MGTTTIMRTLDAPSLLFLVQRFILRLWMLECVPPSCQAKADLHRKQERSSLGLWQATALPLGLQA
jgi:hypothetical protein